MIDEIIKMLDKMSEEDLLIFYHEILKIQRTREDDKDPPCGDCSEQ